MSDQCLICKAEVSEDEGTRSPWSFVPHDREDVHLRLGNIICSECYTRVWGAIQLTLKSTLLALKDCRFGESAKAMPDNVVFAPDMERIFRKVVASDSPSVVPVIKHPTVDIEATFRKVVAAGSPRVADR